MTTTPEQFCLYRADESNMKHMERYRDIICVVSEAKNLDVKNEIEDIEKVHDTCNYSFFIDLTKLKFASMNFFHSLIFFHQ